jgi:aquaporin Z
MAVARPHRFDAGNVRHTGANNPLPEYLMEGAELGLLMLAVTALSVLLLGHGASAQRSIHSALLRRALLAAGVGVTVTSLIYSPIGRRSGAHFNPAVTLTFFRLGKVRRADAIFYVVFQLLGAVAGVGLAAVALGGRLSDRSVDYAATVPGSGGTAAAFAAELGLAFVFMSILLVTVNGPYGERWTGVVAGSVIALFIFIEAPVSGMSLNPARSVGSAVPAGHWGIVWVYLIAPVAGMQLAADAYVRVRGRKHLRSAKLIHDDRTRCIFLCDCHGGRQRAARPR